MSQLRPTLIPATIRGLSYSATYFRVLEAVQRRTGLIHGRLKNRQGRTCAVGAYFHEANIPLNVRAIDEISAYNDSFPALTPPQRWRKVLAWLRFETTRMARTR